MSGGARDRVAAYNNIIDIEANMLLSGFELKEISEINKKYFDVYDNSDSLNSYEKRILGDATGELGPFDGGNSWYHDVANFVSQTNLWFRRGGHCNDISSGAGEFVFASDNGKKDSNNGSRLVLSPK